MHREGRVSASGADSKGILSWKVKHGQPHKAVNSSGSNRKNKTKVKKK